MNLVLPLLSAFIGAVIAQLLSHYFAVKRDKKKDFMQKYQDLYSKSLVYLSNYMAIKTNPRKYHDVHHNVVEGDLLDIAIEELKDNIKHASPVLLKVYERYIGYGYYEDGWGSKEEAEKHVLAYFLLDDLIQSSKGTGMFRKSDRDRLKYLRFYFGLCAMSLIFFDMSETEQIIYMENFSGVQYKIRYKSFKRELLSLNRLRMANQLLKHIYNVKLSYIDEYKELIIELNQWIKKFK
ncbi:hypothetical protein ACQKCU_23930 [Heyndrickxia sporothermodurans]